MGLTELYYIDEQLLNETGKTTTIELKNPDHPEVIISSGDYLDIMTEGYKAGIWAKENLGQQRSLLVGHFLTGVKALEEDDDPEVLKDLLQQLTR